MFWWNEYMWDYGRKRLFLDVWPKANWEVGELPLTATSKAGCAVLR